MMMFVLAYFMTANTIFMHTHRCIDGNVVTHSHPYVPSSHHTHSAQAFGAIDAFNLAAGSLNTAAATVLPAASGVFVVIDFPSFIRIYVGNTIHFGLRAPPCA